MYILSLIILLVWQKLYKSKIIITYVHSYLHLYTYLYTVCILIICIYAVLQNHFIVVFLGLLMPCYLEYDKDELFPVKLGEKEIEFPI